MPSHVALHQRTAQHGVWRGSRWSRHCLCLTSLMFLGKILKFSVSISSSVKRDKKHYPSPRIKSGLTILTHAKHLELCLAPVSSWPLLTTGYFT